MLDGEHRNHDDDFCRDVVVCDDKCGKRSGATSRGLSSANTMRVSQ